MPRSAKITLWFIGIFAVLLTAFYQIENWRGKKSLEKVHAEIVADGEPMTLYEFAGEPPPADENFFKAPLVSSLVDYEVKYSKGSHGFLQSEIIYARPDERERLLAMRLPDPIKGQGYFRPQTGAMGLEAKEIADFEAWAEVFRADPEYAVPNTDGMSDAAFILAVLESRFAEEWKELKLAASHEQSFYRIERNDEFEKMVARPFPIYSDWLEMSKLLDLRIAAAIQEGDFQTFRDTFALYIQFEKGIGKNFVLISNLVVASSHSRLLGLLWSGLNSKSFSDSDLQWITKRLRDIDLRNFTLNSYRGSRILFVQPSMEEAKHSARWGISRFFDYSEILNSPKYWVMIAELVPDGWWDQNAAASLRFNNTEMAKSWKTMDFSGAKGLEARSPSGSSPYSVIARGSSKGLVYTNERFMNLYVMNQLAILACEVEIYALKHGRYPDRLSELIPAQLKTVPLDPFDGKPIKYRTVDDRYLLYSIGLNEIDEHGKVTYRRPGRIDKKSGDWVWDYRAVKKRDDSEPRIKFLDAIRKEMNPNYEAQAPKLEKQRQREEKQRRLERTARQQQNLENAKRKIAAERKARQQH